MSKEYLIEKLSDQKKNKEYKFYRSLEEDNGFIKDDSFNQFIDIEPEDKNLAFFIKKDSISFLSFSNPKKFYKCLLKTYKENISNDDEFSIYLYIRSNELKEDLDKLLENEANIYDLKEKQKTK